MSAVTRTESNAVSLEDELVVDLESAAPSGLPCRVCGTPVDGGDHFCAACGAANPRETPTQKVAGLKFIHVQCSACGAKVETQPDQRSYTCPFCESAYVAEVDTQTQRQRPEFVIGFAITPDRAHEIFRNWLQNSGLFQPGDLSRVQLDKKLRGVYLPCWSFSMLARSRWKAKIGEYWYRTERYTTVENGETVTKTRRIQETEWWNLEGKHHHYYSGYLVSASRGLSQAEVDAVKPFNMPAMKRYQPYFLAGWVAEDYTVDREEALKICVEEFRRREQQSMSGFMPGDTYSNLKCATKFEGVNSDLCLLPVYIMNYRYGQRDYRFMINGQTGKIVGNKPYSYQRMGIATGTLVALGVALYVLLKFLGMKYGF